MGFKLVDKGRDFKEVVGEAGSRAPILVTIKPPNIVAPDVLVPVRRVPPVPPINQACDERSEEQAVGRG